MKFSDYSIIVSFFHEINFSESLIHIKSNIMYLTENIYYIKNNLSFLNISYKQILSLKLNQTNFTLSFNNI